MNHKVFVVKTNFMDDVSPVDEWEISSEFGDATVKEYSPDMYQQQFESMCSVLKQMLGDVKRDEHSITVTMKSVEEYFGKMQEFLYNVSNIKERTVDNFMNDFFNIRRVINAQDVCWIYTGYFKSTTEFLLELHSEMILQNVEEVTITMVQAFERCI